MKVLVTGADGFVGSWLVPKLQESGHEVTAAVRPAGSGGDEVHRQLSNEVPTISLELLDPESVKQALNHEWDAVVHLAAMASGSDVNRDPMAGWKVNTVGTALLVHELGERAVGGLDPVILIASTAEVYGAGSATPRIESDPAQPTSPYAATKLAAECAAMEVHRRTGLRVIVSRAFPHTGPGQDERFVVPAFTRRLRDAKLRGAPAVKVGNLTPVREFTHVADVADAYVQLLQKGQAGEVYNVSSGRGITIRELFFMLTDALEMEAIPEVDPRLVRRADVPYLVGDSRKLRETTGWEPSKSLEQTIFEVARAQAD
ncbi:MAG: GDP-mannose 4,6-dehydratase [Gemmatimonadales bacterium]